MRKVIILDNLIIVFEVGHEYCFSNFNLDANDDMIMASVEPRILLEHENNSNSCRI